MHINAAKTIAIVVSMLLLGSDAFADQISADEILKQVAESYNTVETYKAEGTIHSDIVTGTFKTQQVTSFSIVLKKPNLYRISWCQQGGMAQSGTVWSDGTQPYLYMGVLKAYSKMAGDELALGAATGISGGAAFTVPSLFMPVFKGQPAPLSRLLDPQIENSETVGGEDCYVISASSVISKKETFWIAKKSHLIRKYERSLEAPEGRAAIPEMTDQQLNDAIKALGQEVTDESKQNMRAMMERSRAMVKKMNLKGTSTEFHEDISSPELDKSDFRFSPPEDAVLKESLFGGVLGGNR